MSVALNHFKPHEFGEWWLRMAEDLLIYLDEWRSEIGVPVMISPAPGSIGRRVGSRSMHYWAPGGVVRAVDVMPYVVLADNTRRGLDAEERLYAYQAAVNVGFTGIGCYPETKPFPMFHLDVRPGDHVATWSGWRKHPERGSTTTGDAMTENWDYRSIQEAFL